MESTCNPFITSSSDLQGSIGEGTNAGTDVGACRDVAVGSGSVAMLHLRFDIFTGDEFTERKEKVLLAASY